MQRKDKIIKIFHTLYSKYSKKFTSSELLQIAEDIVTARGKSKNQSYKFGTPAGISDYFTRDSFQMLTQNPWEVAVRENELITLNDYKSTKLRSYLWKI
tara:strand:- start:781 stop:1077 length:297 start_codon:yes stop_codon:yes gene_type:complete